MTRLSSRIALLLAALAVPAGCRQSTRPQAPGVADGLILMVPGIDGSPSELREMNRAVRESGVNAEVAVYDWRRPELFGSLANLSNLQRNHEHAERLARQVTQFRAQHPQAAVDLIGYSGGGGLVLMAAEKLPEEVRLRHLILVHAAVSPSYPLTEALRRLDGRLVSFYSPLDLAILGLGTWIFGTIDRRFTPSAGCVGFDLPAAVTDPQLLQRLEQRAWTTDMIRSGHWGGHLGALSYTWTKTYLLPYLNPREE